MYAPVSYTHLDVYKRQSDNIPGVAGVGAKTALDLIFRFHNLDYIYDNLDELDIKPGVKACLLYTSRCV